MPCLSLVTSATAHAVLQRGEPGRLTWVLLNAGVAEVGARLEVVEQMPVPWLGRPLAPLEFPVCPARPATIGFEVDTRGLAEGGGYAAELAVLTGHPGADMALSARLSVTAAPPCRLAAEEEV